MAENQRHWKQTTTGRKNIPIVEAKKTKKSKEPQSLEEALTENQQPRPFIPIQGRMTPQHGTGLWYMEKLMKVTFVYRGVAYTRVIG